MGFNEEKESPLLSYFAYIWSVSVIGAIICGILEALNISTGVIGGIIALIVGLPLPLALCWFICCGIIRLFYPFWEKDKVERRAIYLLIFLIISLLWAVIFK